MFLPVALLLDSMATSFFPCTHSLSLSLCHYTHTHTHAHTHTHIHKKDTEAHMLIETGSRYHERWKISSVYVQARRALVSRADPSIIRCVELCAGACLHSVCARAVSQVGSRTSDKLAVGCSWLCLRPLSQAPSITSFLPLSVSLSC